MTWLRPGFLMAGLLAAAAVVALHLIMHRLPPLTRFPTARFIPPGTARAIRRAMRPDDLLLLALRATMLILIGAALARPLLMPPRRPVARIVLLDRSRAIGSMDEARDSAGALLGPADLLIVFDSTASVGATHPDSVAGIRQIDAKGNLSGALVAAIQAAPALRPAADSVEIALVTAATREEMDGATLAVRGIWPGRVRIVRVAADSALQRDIAEAGRRISAPEGDPVGAAVALWGLDPDRAPIRIVRAALTPDDSAWARRGGALVHWPVVDSMGAGDADSIGAVLTEQAVVVAAFARRSLAREARNAPDAVAVAWWSDGRPAAVEQPLGDGCVRTVAIDIPRRGDLVLRPAFRRLLHSLTGPCGTPVDDRAIGAAALTALAGSGPLARTSELPVRTQHSSVAPWLLAAALLLALVEPLARRRPAAA